MQRFEREAQVLASLNQIVVRGARFHVRQRCGPNVGCQRRWRCVWLVANPEVCPETLDRSRKFLGTAGEIMATALIKTPRHQIVIPRNRRSESPCPYTESVCRRIFLMCSIASLPQNRGDTLATYADRTHHRATHRRARQTQPSD
jgi:hypothetical protein